MNRICVLTTGRQDWGILRRICQLGRASPALDLRIIAGGMALSAAHGMSVRAMEEEGLSPDERVDWLGREGLGGRASGTVHEEAGAALAMIGDALARLKPDGLLLVGDRFETMAAAMAATLLRVPIVHLHGGEETEGAFDNALRHAITKLSHLHLVSHPEHARRVLAMGEAPSNVHIVGAPGLDALHTMTLAPRAELEARLGLSLPPPVVIVTLHPATLGGDPAVEASCICEVMDRVAATYVVTLPNNDPGAAIIREMLTRAAARSPRRVAVEALGSHYGSLMAVADAMLGNSSSALIEAPALGLPAVNVGARQRGRLRGPNVIDASAEVDPVTAALERALDPTFRAAIREPSRALFAAGASERVIAILERWAPPQPPIKSTVVSSAPVGSG